MKNIVFLILVSSILVSCNKNEEVIQPESKSLKSKENVDLFGLKSFPNIDQESDIFVCGNMLQGKNYRYSIYAEFYDNNGNLTSVDEIKVNNDILNYQQGINAYTKDDDLNNYASSFGDSLKVNVLNSPFGNYSHTIYNPKLIEVTGIIQNGINIIDSASQVVNQNGNLEINWNSDPNFDSDLLLIVIPRPYAICGDQRCDDNIPTIQEVIPNNGSYTLNDSYFDHFQNIDVIPETDGFDIILGVANQDIVNHSSDKETLITVFNYDNYNFKIVK